MIDFRSDTVTKPTPGMLQAMMNAPVGDDVFGEDPSINQLEEMAAKLFDMEAALYCPSGTMSNQIAIRCHTQPGDEVICASNAHVYIYEGGGIASNSGSQVKTMVGDFGRINAEQVVAAINYYRGWLMKFRCGCRASIAAKPCCAISCKCADVAARIHFTDHRIITI